MKRTVENIKDPLFRFFEREVNTGARLLVDVRRDLEDVMKVCLAEKKPTNHHRSMMADLVKGEKKTLWCKLKKNKEIEKVMIDIKKNPVNLKRSTHCSCE